MCSLSQLTRIHHQAVALHATFVEAGMLFVTGGPVSMTIAPAAAARHLTIIEITARGARFMALVLLFEN
jgi:hypothetical protein